MTQGRFVHQERALTIRHEMDWGGIYLCHRVANAMVRSWLGRSAKVGGSFADAVLSDFSQGGETTANLMPFVMVSGQSVLAASINQLAILRSISDQ